MMSILALTGYALGGIGLGGGGDGHDPAAAPVDAPSAPPDTLSLDLLQEPAAETPQPPETLDFERGARITGFDPARDVLELEYSAALDAPEVTITDFPDGTGASVALNGVVVADIEGAQGLSPESVILKAV